MKKYIETSLISDKNKTNEDTSIFEVKKLCIEYAKEKIKFRNMYKDLTNDESIFIDEKCIEKDIVKCTNIYIYYTTDFDQEKLDQMLSSLIR